MRELLNRFRVSPIFNQVRNLVRIDVVIVEFPAFASFIPFGVTPARRSETIAKERQFLLDGFGIGASATLAAGARYLRQCSPAPRHRRILQHWR